MYNESEQGKSHRYKTEWSLYHTSCDLGQALKSLWASVFSSIKWGLKSAPGISHWENQIRKHFIGYNSTVKEKLFMAL